ncbi:MAG: VWA domain-containing protein [Gemmataceae bacterium]|nr:VWA domain-containing protein [Gemmataceae bacterium]
MASEPKEPRISWGAVVGCFAILGLVFAASITTIGSKANLTFSTVGSSITSGGGGYSYSTHSPDRLGGLPDDPNGPSTANYDRIYDNPLMAARENPLSTFSVNVDTASYSNARRFLNEGALPPKDAVRVADFVNYFGYDYPEPTGEHPISITADAAGCPWNDAHRLVRIGLRAKRIAPEAMPPRNLVFLVDVSGSMNAPKRLPLVKAGLNLLIEQLTDRDRVAIVVYAGEAGVRLPSTTGDRKDAIRKAVDRLRASGGTNGGEGIQLAYRIARQNFMEHGVNRVILATDGDFNVGVTSQGELVRLIEDQRKSGVYLTILGFGMDNLKDATLEKLADKGAGHYAYIDSLAEARKVFVEEGAALTTVAKDVKVQVEFNPKRVAAYRLIGYENRLLRAQDFNNDATGATPMGAGHTVTALYEVVPAGGKGNAPGVDPLKYQQPADLTAVADDGELLTVKLRYKEPREEASKLMSKTIAGGGLPFDKAPEDFRFAATVAAFGQLLRDSQHKGEITYADVRRLAEGSLGLDGRGHRAELVQLVEKAQRLSGNGARD